MNDSSPRRLAVIGRGRLGTALAAGLRAVGHDVNGPLGRDYEIVAPVEAVLLCVDDDELPRAAAALAERWPADLPLPVAGHCSGASDLIAVEPFEAFSLHPLMTVAPGTVPDFHGVAAAIAGATPRARALAEALARDLGMAPLTLDPGDRAAYHAAASIASNFLISVQAAAERLAATAGVERQALLPLVRQTVENWARDGAAALTGPIARGDEHTVAAQRHAIAVRAPELLELFDALADATRALVDRGPAPGNDRPTVLRTVDELRRAVAAARRRGTTIGLVPTMGALHEGHLSLIRRARQECDEVIVSVFVNPAQFDDPADLDRYPGDEARDLELASQAGAGAIFAPDAREIYPPGFATTVEVSAITEHLEGAVRGPEHFRGVATVVAKLLIAACPDAAYFGQKDAQQLAVVRRLVGDLELPVRIEACPTVREDDGLAASSRNRRLSPPDRARAVALPLALAAAERAAAAGVRDAGDLVAAARAAMAPHAVEPEYLALVDPDTMSAVDELAGPALLAVAARLGDIRLIDNVLLQPAPSKAEPAPSPSVPQVVKEQPCNA